MLRFFFFFFQISYFFSLTEHCNIVTNWKWKPLCCSYPLLRSEIIYAHFWTVYCLLCFIFLMALMSFYLCFLKTKGRISLANINKFWASLSCTDAFCATLIAGVQLLQLTLLHFANEKQKLSKDNCDRPSLNLYKA